MIPFLGIAMLTLGQANAPLRFEATKGEDWRVAARLPAKIAAKLPMGKLTQDQGEAILGVALIPPDSKTPGPAMLGRYERTGESLLFTPRFGFDPGHTYRATLMLDGKATTLDYRIPALSKQTPPKVVKVYPTADVLPANHLKFYIYFDRPMRGGKEIFDQIVLLDDKGKVIDAPWLYDEIWDHENNCLIIYIHPGRIKWGVLLRELLGPVLFERRNYSLVVRGDMRDPAGNKIGTDYVKKFRTTPEDRVRIDLSQWKLTTPKAETRGALTLTFPKAIDHRSLERFLSVTDESGAKVAGTFALDNAETIWRFTPMQMWTGKGYRINVDPRLEDVAGNTPSQPFDVDLRAAKLPPQKLRLDFQP